MNLDDAGGIDEAIPSGVAFWSNAGADPFDAAPTPYVVEPGGGEDHDRHQRQDSSSSDSDLDNHQEEQGHFPSSAPTIDARPLVLRIKVFPFTKPPEQDYIWKMTSRRLGDISVTEFINYLASTTTLPSPTSQKWRRRLASTTKRKPWGRPPANSDPTLHIGILARTSSDFIRTQLYRSPSLFRRTFCNPKYTLCNLWTRHRIFI